MKKIKDLKRYAASIIVTVCVLLVNIGAFYDYYTSTYDNLKEQTTTYLNNVVEEAAQCVNIKIAERFNTLKALAMYISTYSNNNFTNIHDVLDAQSTVEGFSDYDIVGLDGIGLKDKGLIDYNEKSFYDNAIKGKTALACMADEFERPKCIVFSTPLYKNDDICGALLTFCAFDEFSTFTDLSAFGQNGNTFIVKQNGELLTRGNGLDEVESISQILSDDTKAASKLISSMKQKTVGNVTYGSGIHKKYLCFSKTAYNKWYVVTIVSAETVEGQVTLIQDDGITFLFEIGALFVILILYFIYLITSHIRNGQINKERYFIATDNFETVFFDYSIKKDTMYCNDKWENIFGYKLPKENMKFIMTKYVFEEDVNKFNRRVARLDKNNTFVKLSIRLINNDNEPISCLMKLYAIKGFGGKLTKILGVIETINKEEKENEIEIQKEAEKQKEVEKQKEIENK